MEMRPRLPEDSRHSKRGLVLEHIASLLIAVGAFVTFTGNTYFDAKLNQFGLAAGVLEVGQGEIIANGVFAAIWGVFLTAWRGRSELAIGISIAPILLLSWWLFSRFTPLGLRSRERLEAVLEQINSNLLRFCVLALALMTATIAGRIGGAYDANAIWSAVEAGHGQTYVTTNALICGILVGQDQHRSIVATKKGVFIVKADEIVRVSLTAACPGSTVK
jgi:hypothetical protein